VATEALSLKLLVGSYVFSRLANGGKTRGYGCPKAALGREPAVKPSNLGFNAPISPNRVTEVPCHSALPLNTYVASCRILEAVA
jgi:hypothetical protein